MCKISGGGGGRKMDIRGSGRKGRGQERSRLMSVGAMCVDQLMKD